jgi:hypothetical protein
MSEKPSVTPRHELAEQARAHYEELSSAACSWNSAIPQAIDAWEREEQLQKIAEELPGLLRRWALEDTTERAYSVEDYIKRKLNEAKDGG